mmetsp:Transcript_52332/g.144976  ORF Transcript_52332/g.144976 Transcript_52332/m.144976 type:complete len:202 (-) Transcript_52332:34-639(-)
MHRWWFCAAPTTATSACSCRGERSTRPWPRGSSPPWGASGSLRTRTAARPPSARSSRSPGSSTWAAWKVLRRWSRRPRATAAPPLAFQPFARGAKVDWWFLLLDGEGSFRVAEDRHKCASVEDLLPMLPGSAFAPTFGHAWVPVDGFMGAIPPDLFMSGVMRRVQQAVCAAHCWARRRQRRVRGAPRVAATARGGGAHEGT